METITQTNRTLLFSEINPERLNLLTLIGDVRGKNSLDDDKIKEINEELVVSGFNDFLDKFSPVVYSWCDASSESIQYSLVKPENIPDSCVTEIPLNESNDLLNMLITLLDAKDAQGLANVDFGFSNVLDMISPKKIMEDIRQVRREIQYTYGKYMELDEGDPKRLDLGDKLNYQFEQASKNYNNVLAMLPLAIEDIKTRLLLGDGETKQGGQDFKAGLLSMGEDGELKILEMKQEESTRLAVVDDHINTSLIETFKEDYDELNENPSDYVRDLVVRTFCPLSSTMESNVDRKVEVHNYNNYLEFYKKSKDDFVKAVKPLIEKILGVKTFFDQYKVKEKGMQPKLLITNTSLDLLVKSSNLPRLLTYLNTTNDKNEFENTVWFGIVPDVELTQTGGGKLHRIRFAGNQKVENQGTNSMESLAALMNALLPYKITTFFSFRTGEETSFSYIATEGIGIERMLRFYSGDFKQDKILKFFSSNPSSQKSKWDTDRQHVNSILQDGDELDFAIDEKNGICNVQVTFANVTKNLKVHLTRKAGEK